MSTRVPLLALATLAVLVGGCGSASEDGAILVFAAASLADVAPELGAAYTAETGVPVLFGFGSSAALARQIAAGAPADFFFTADLSLLHAAGHRLAAEGACLRVATNALVVVRPAGQAEPWTGWSGVDAVAVGDWRAQVPVGTRAREWALARGDWSELEPRLIPCADARSALNAVSSGAAGAGIVYATDAASTPRVEVVERAGPSAPLTHYTACELSGSRPGSWSLVEYLVSEEARAIWNRHGFGLGAPADSGAAP